MKTATTGKLSRLAMSLLVSFAVLGGVGAGLASGTTDSDAKAIKWNEGDVSATTTGNGLTVLKAETKATKAEAKAAKVDAKTTKTDGCSKSRNSLDLE